MIVPFIIDPTNPDADQVACKHGFRRYTYLSVLIVRNKISIKRVGPYAYPNKTMHRVLSPVLADG